MKARLIGLLIVLAFCWDCIHGQAGPSELFPIKQNGKYGYIDQTGKIVIQPRFDCGYNFSEGLAVVMVEDETGRKKGFIDRTGKYIIKPQFLPGVGCYQEFSEGVAAVNFTLRRKIKGKWVDKKEWGFIDKGGRVTLIPDLALLFDFQDGLAIFMKSGRLGYMNRKFKVVIKPKKLQLAGDFYFGRARVTYPNGAEYFINNSGRRLFKTRDGGDFSESKAYFLEKGKYGFIDTKGRVLIKAQFDGAKNFGEGLAGVKIGGKWGFIDEKGSIVIPPRFEDVGVFHEGLVAVAMRRENLLPKWGFADKSGNIVIQPQFSWPFSRFENGLSQVMVYDGSTTQKDTLVGYIDAKGNFVWPLSK